MRASFIGLPPVDVRGMDVGEGGAVLAVSVVVLSAVPVSRVPRETTGWAWLLVAAGLAACGLGLAGILAADARLGVPPAERLAPELARSTGLPEEELRASLEATAPDVRHGALGGRAHPVPGLADEVAALRGFHRAHTKTDHIDARVLARIPAVDGSLATFTLLAPAELALRRPVALRHLEARGGPDGRSVRAAAPR